VDFALSSDQEAVRDAVREVCGRFGDEYWRGVDASGAYPDEFVEALTEGGWLAVLIPEEFGGAGLGITEAALVLEEINRSGGNGAVCHAQMYTMGTLLRHGSEVQKRRYLPEIAEGRLRLQAFAVTEPTSGSDTTRIATQADRTDDGYVVSGQKVFISRAQQSDLMLLLARTTSLAQVDRKTEGLSVFLVDLRETGPALEIRPLDVMLNHHTNELFLDRLEIPHESLVGEEGQGFRYILDGMNAERILVASEAIGDGRWFVERGSTYASEREVFGRPIGANQGIQFPLAQAHAEVEAASLIRFAAAALFDTGEPCGPQANMAKLLASQASWRAANACMTAFGGYGFAREFDVERKFREAKLLEIAPVSNNMILAYIGQRVLDMPRSY
jgi:acyl-CoA dehydrogenase